MAKRLKLDEWADGRARPIAILAQTVAVSAPSCHEAITQARKGLPGFKARTDRWSLDDWLGCYSKPRALEGVLLQFAFSPHDADGIPAARVAWANNRREIFRTALAGALALATKGDWNRQVKKVRRYFECGYRANLHELEGQIYNREAAPDCFRTWLATPEFIFFLAVAVPCWLRNREWPAAMFRRAAKGDLSALESLVQLDPLVLHDNAIGQMHFQLHATNPERAALLRNGRELQIPTLEETKFVLAGMLYRLSRDLDYFASGEAIFEHALKHTLQGRIGDVRRWVKSARKQIARQCQQPCGKWKLDPKDLRGLFDAAAVDLGIGLVDPDFSQSRETFQKRIKRNGDAWPTLR